MSLRVDEGLGSDIARPNSAQGSVISSLWSSIFSESNVSSDVAFYRRASWLEDYANQRARYLDVQSEEKRALRSKHGLLRYLLMLLPCAKKNAKRAPTVCSSRTSLASMLQENEENQSQLRPQRVIMITSSL